MDEFLEQAIKNLQGYSFVGIFENYDEDARRLAKQFNWSYYATTERHRKTAPIPELDLQDGKIRDQIELCNQYDLKLYEQRKEMNDTQL
jgi:hypothetical protein